MEEFMAQAHDKRLAAMEAVKAEVQRGYEEQIAELQAKASDVTYAVQPKLHVRSVAIPAVLLPS